MRTTRTKKRRTRTRTTSRHATATGHLLRTQPAQSATSSIARSPLLCCFSHHSHAHTFAIAQSKFESQSNFIPRARDPMRSTSGAQRW